VHTALTAVWSHIVQVLTICKEKIWYQWPMADYTFFDCHSSFSLVKAAINAPHVRKLCKNCLTGVDQWRMVLSKRIYDSKLPQRKKYIQSA
jgi:hypothetical protein